MTGPLSRRLRPLLIAVLSSLSLAACSGVTDLQPSDPPTRMRTPVELPPMKTFDAYQPAPILATNRQIAVDFLELSFRMESGRVLERFTRFEEPIYVSVRGDAPTTLGPDLARLIDRLRREAGINISRAGRSDDPSIIVETMPRRELQRYVPQAACFVVPNVGSWAEFLRRRRTRDVDWTLLQERTRAAVFIPNDVSPQEVRDCLHEEIAQALGPLNDLYRLPSSVFNDDNFHPVLTSYDMLILRMTYAPELRNGMSQDEVAAQLPNLLARLNPSGIRGSASEEPDNRREWINAIETALGPGTRPARRDQAARAAVQIAQRDGITDSRLAFSYFALGRIALGSDPQLSLASFLQAGGLYQSRPGTEVQQAHVAMQIAAFALTNGDSDTALRLINGALPAVEQSENAALLSTLLMMKAATLETLDLSDQAAAVRLDSLGWARYGIGDDDRVRARLAEISALAPPRQGS